MSIADVQSEIIALNQQIATLTAENARLEGRVRHIEQVRRTLAQFATQKNTGNVYEIATALTLLREMGVTDEALRIPLLEKIATFNSKKSDEIRRAVAMTIASPVGTGLTFDGHTVTDILCATQDDSVGTGDFVLVTTAGRVTLSVCEGTVRKDGSIQKCLSNPTCRRFKCTDEDVAQFKRIQTEGVVAYKAFMAETYGPAESEWPSGLETEAAKTACNKVAVITANRFAGLNADEKIAIFQDIMRIDDGKKPADYLAVVHKKTLTSSFFRFGATKIPAVPEPRLVVNGIYLDCQYGDAVIGKTQVKCNNGIYKRGKTSSIYSSWNGTFILTDIFTMSPVALGNAGDDLASAFSTLAL